MDYRRYKRVPARLTLLIYRKEVLVASGMLRNISKSGLYISTNCPNLDINQEVEIEFDLHDPTKPGNKRLKGTLVHRNHGGLGVEFAGRGDPETPELRSLLNWVEETNLLINRPYTASAVAF